MSHSISRGKRSQKFLSPWKQLFFEMFVSIDLCAPEKNVFITCTTFVKKPCGPSKIVSWHLSCSILREKIGQNLFFARNFAFFSQNFVFLTTSLVPKNWSYYFHNKCQNTSWTLRICFLTFVMFDNMGTNRPKSFLHLKICLYLPIFWVFNNLLGPKKLILLLPQSSPKYLLDPYKVFLEFCYAR